MLLAAEDGIGDWRRTTRATVQFRLAVATAPCAVSQWSARPVVLVKAAIRLAAALRGVLGDSSQLSAHLATAPPASRALSRPRRACVAGGAAHGAVTGASQLPGAEPLRCPPRR